MTAGAAVVDITGLTASTAYKYYFVAKDAANNDQAAFGGAGNHDDGRGRYHATDNVRHHHSGEYRPCVS